MNKGVAENFGISNIDKNYDARLAIKQKQRKTDEFIIFTCYQTAENSVWGRDSFELFAHMWSLISTYNDYDDMFIAADLNASIAELLDAIEYCDSLPERKSLDKNCKTT
jgi:hypothetical protein